MIEAKNLSKHFLHEGTTIAAIDDVNFKIEEGHSLAICGVSGAGKSTLLNLLGGLDLMTSGQVLIHEQNMQEMSEAQEARFRRENLGFIFQFHHLLDDFTILENVMMPLLINRMGRGQAKKQAQEILERVGILDRMDHYSKELSGGEQQRAAIARALVHKPKIILADEPTGNLDESNGQNVFELLCGLNRDLGATLIVVTHSQFFAKKLNYILTLDKGRVKSFQ